jgi:dolichyl-phosphate beta-glucosyltransferase
VIAFRECSRLRGFSYLVENVSECFTDALVQPYAVSEATMDLSVIVPVYNGEPFIAQTIRDLVGYLAVWGERAELIVVDDGSTDRTAEIVADATADTPIPVRVLLSPENQGKGAAIARGMGEAVGKYRVFLDADLAYPPQAIGEILASLTDGADVVIGNRVHIGSTYQVRPSFFRYLYTRHVAGRIFNWLVRVVLLPGIYDTQAGLKGFTAAAAEALFGRWMPAGFSFDLAILVRAQRDGLTIAQIPVQYRYDSEPTTVRFLSDSVDALRDIAMIRVRFGGPFVEPLLMRIQAWRSRQLKRLQTAISAQSATWVGAASMLAGLAGHAIFRFEYPNEILAAAFWLLAVGGLLLLAAKDDSGMATKGGKIFPTRTELVVFLLILGVTAFLRMWRLSELPPTVHGDSAECGIQGLRILMGDVKDIFGFSPWYFTPYPAHLPYALSFALAGVTVLGLRLPSAVVGTLSVIPLYFLVRNWLGRRPAQIASILFALSHPAIHFSRIGLWNIQVMFLELVAFAFLATALRRASAAWAAVAGIVAGLGFYSYTAGRLILIVSLTLLAIQFLLGERRKLVPVGVFLGAGFLVALSPLAVSYMKSPEVLESDRTGSVLAISEFNQAHVRSVTHESTLAGILRVQAVRSLKGFFNLGDRSGQYGTEQPLTSPLTAALALCGLLVLVWRFREVESQLLVVWTVLGLVLGSVLIIDPPSATRLIVLFPVPYILVAVFLEQVFRRLDPKPKSIAIPIIWGVVFVIFGEAVVFNLGGYRRYITVVDAEARSWDMVKTIEKYGNKYEYYIFGGPAIAATNPTLRLFERDKRLVNGVTPLDLPDSLIGDTVIMVPRILIDLEPQLRNLGEVVTERFPDSERVRVGGSDRGELLLYFVSTDGGPPRFGGSVDDPKH